MRGWCPWGRTSESRSPRLDRSEGVEQARIGRPNMTSGDDKPLTPRQARQKLQKGLRDHLAGNDPGPIVFRIKRTKKAGETYPLRLTRLQRETLLQFTRLNRSLKRKIEQAGEGTQVVG